MKKANIASIIFFLSFTGYLICGGAVELLLTELKFVVAIKVLLPALLVSFFISAVIFYILNKFIWADGQRVQPGTKLFNKFSVLIISISCLFGGFRQFESAYKTKEEARIAKEKIDSMTDEEKKLIADNLRLEKEDNVKLENERKKLKEEESKRFTNTLALLKSIKDNMRDPSSFDLISARANEIGSVVCIEYRGKNGFGGNSKEFAVYANKKISQSPEVWNKYCLASLFEMNQVKYAL